MKVALLTREYPPEVYGGAGVHVEYLARELARHVEVAVHCFGEPRHDALPTASYQPWSRLAGDAPHRSALRTMSVDLAMAAGVEGAEVVHSHTWYANFAGHLAKLLYGIPHVATTHSLEPLRPWKAEQLGGGYALSSFCERTGLEGADLVVAVSAGMRDDVLGAYPAIDPERVGVVHNGVDVTEYAPDHGTDVLERHGIDAQRPSVVFVGRITRQKGLGHLLTAAERLHPDAQLVLCAGAADTPEIAAEVRDRVDRLRAHRTGVVWLQRMLPRAEVVQILSHATAFACPSVYEPFGLVNLEAMACAAPVVASATGGIPEIVVEGETGFLVPLDPDGDPSAFAGAFADRLNRLVADPHLAAAMGGAGRRRAEERFSWPVIAERTARLYERLG
ncbi:MAG: glycogen synthase [Euzebyales bacterium]|nr:glycogen synthase [Euzebyales bacterium]